MLSDPNERAKPPPEPILSTGAEPPMSAEQEAQLRQLARDAYEPEAFNEHLTCSEAERRIVTLKAKMKRLGEPPHTL